MTTNASDPTLALALTSIHGMLPVSLVIKKKGVERGASKRIFGDDRVHVLLLVGVEYRELVERSKKKLDKIGQSGSMARDVIDEARKMGNVDVTLEDVFTAFQELQETFDHNLNTGEDAEIEWDTTQAPGVWAPLEFNGVPVPACKVYTGPGRPEDPRAPVPGEVYIRGLKLAEKVIEPSPNGDWIPRSKGKTVAKNILKKRLPVGRFVSYILRPKEGVIQVGADAVRAADADGLEIPAGVADNLLKMSGG